MITPDGFPGKEEALQLLDGGIKDNRTDLQQLATHVLGKLDSGISDNHADLQQLHSAGYAPQYTPPKQPVKRQSQPIAPPPTGYPPTSKCQIFAPFNAPPNAQWWAVINIGVTPCPVFGSLASLGDCTAADITEYSGQPTWPVLGPFSTVQEALTAAQDYVAQNYPNCAAPQPPTPCPPGTVWDPVTEACIPVLPPPPPPPPPPTPTCPGGGLPDPITGQCPPTPPPTPPPTQGTSCDTPLYVKLCIDAPPIQQCTPTEPPAPTDNSGIPVGFSANEVFPGGSGFPTGGAPTTTAGCTPTIIPLPQSSPAAIFADCLVDGQIPPVGSSAWCSCINSLHHWFADFGSAAIAIFGCVDATNPNVQQQQATPFIQQLIAPLTPLPLIGSVIQNIANGIQSVVQSLCNTVGQPALTQIVTGGSELIGLTIARTIIRLLKNARVGTDAAIWLTIDIEVELRPIEKVLDYLTNYVMTTEIPSIGEALECYLNNTAPPELVKCWLLLRGAEPSVWDSVLYARREKLTTDEVIEAARRANLNPKQQVDALRNYGWIDEDEAITRVKLYDEIPAPADFLHYLQRNVYDTQYVQDYGLLEGFDQRYWANFGAQLSAIGVTYERSKLDYAAHWIRPAPGELREFVYRTNPEYYDGNNPTTVDDYRRTLTEQDYSPWDVKRYVETLYRVPALGYLRDMYRSYLLSDEQMKVYHQKLGYSSDDSDHFVEIDKLVRARMRASETHGWTPQALAAAYSVGVVSDSDVIARMNDLGYSGDEAQTLMVRAQAELQRTIISRARSRVVFSVLTQVKQALASGILDTVGATSAIVELGWPVSFAESWVQIQSATMRVALVKETTRKIRSAYLSGEITLDYAATALSQLGIVASASQQMLVAWELQNTPNRKRRTTSQIVADLANNDISTEDALIRLTNLGVPDADQRLYLADAKRKILAAEAKAQAAEQKSEQQAANELAREQRSAQALAERLQRRLRMLHSPSFLDKLAALGRIGRDKYFDFYRAMQFDDTDIQRHWEVACAKKNASCVKTTPANGTAYPSSTGTGLPPE